MFCSKCLIGELVRLPEGSSADYQCSLCGVFYFDYEECYPESEEDYIQWQ